MFRPLGQIPLGIDDNLVIRLNAARLRAPDSLVVGLAAGKLVLQPVDFKFSLDHADGGQILPDVAIAAGDALEPEIANCVKAIALGHYDAGWREAVVAGILVAPPSPSNRRTRVPGNPLIRWIEVSPAEFFSRLPARDVSGWLQEQDGARDPNGDFDLWEAYYRLGIGIAGAVSRLQTSVFAAREPGEVVPAGLPAVQAFSRSHGAHNTAELIEVLRPAMAARRELESAINQVRRRPGSREMLNNAIGLPPDTPIEAWPPQARRALGVASAQDRAEFTRRARELARSQPDSQVLAQLVGEQRERSSRFVDRLREIFISLEAGLA